MLLDHDHESLFGCQQLQDQLKQFLIPLKRLLNGNISLWVKRLLVKQIEYKKIQRNSMKVEIAKNSTAHVRESNPVISKKSNSKAIGTIICTN